ncbi:hypothetical protein KK062_14295 [Fulvivirgaceae bacterium PWU5]|uniref:Uncharacterized protein n=1 Tax=Dawidia cretensis TaxID=2782350 RepID=A0AAP2GQJ8_9BACT|nr:hypothetical protein [Dawidia cretensis]MBT1709409.1 hypothetical protein [Dawidia cretensis]
MKRYILEHNPFDSQGSYNIYPDVDASGIESQSALSRVKKYYADFYPEGSNSFKGMRLAYAQEIGAPEQPHALCDMHSWIGIRPTGLTFPVSPRFKEVLAPFNTPELTFYNGSIGWKGKETEFYVMHLLAWQLQYINFQESTFQKSDFLGRKVGDEPPLKGDSWPDLKAKFPDSTFTIADAVMNPEFETLDMYDLDIWGILITERVKNAIEANQLTGVKIKECPLDFRIASSGRK